MNWTPGATPDANASTEKPQPLFFHLQFHPQGIQQKQIHTAYNETLLAPLLEHKQHLIIALS
jgi:hypothetical protein